MCVKGALRAGGHAGLVRIQVDCRTSRGKTEPRSFVLGHHKLWVLQVLERHHNTASLRFKVRTTDGRQFALRQDLGTGGWELGAVTPSK